MRVAIAFVALVAVALAASSSRVFLENPKGYTIPSSWTVSGADKTADHRLLFAVKQQNLDVLDALFWEVSDPNHSNWGKYLSLEELTEIVAPKDEHFATLMAFLSQFETTSIDVTVNRDWVAVHAPVGVCEQILAVRFLALTHIWSGITVTRTNDAYSLPAEVAEAVDFVAGVYRLPTDSAIAKRKAMPETFARKGKHAESGSSYGYGFPGEKIVPDNIYASYNVTDQGKSPQNSMAVGEFQEQYFLESDLSAFFNLYKLPNNKVTNIINNENSAAIESSLDIEYIMATAVDVPSWFIYDSAGGFEFFEQVLNYFVTQGNTTNTPYVHSISYGEPERDIDGSLLDRVNTEFQKFGARGRSIFFASGDSGAGCFLCFETNPDFAASSPYVTSVGATYLNKLGEQGFYISGGGFSRSFPRPSYQDNAVEGFLNSSTSLPDPLKYHGKNRGYPDLAAFGSNFQVMIAGEIQDVAGTSCASPTTAGIFALLNDILLQHNMPTIGFANPFIYGLGEGSGCFNDITTGTNADSCCDGFSAQTGWDAMSGFGSPNYGCLKGKVLELIAKKQTERNN